MNNSAEAEPQHVKTEAEPQLVKADFLIWPEKGLNRKDQAALETKIRSVIDAGAQLHSCDVGLAEEGIRFWVAALTPEQGDEIKRLPKVCLCSTFVECYRACC